MSKSVLKDSFFIGLALFALFFGAGNLVFPPSVGLLSGEDWFTGAIGLVISGVLLPVTGIWAINNAGGNAKKLAHHVHPKCYTIFCVIGWIIGSMGSTLPRACAVTMEVGIQPLFPSVPAWLVAAVFFALTFLLAKDSGSVVDKVGKYLTPTLLVILAIVLIKGIIMPIGEPASAVIDNSFTNAMYQGYVIGDLSIAIMSGNVFVYAIKAKGYGRKDEKKALFMVGVFCFIVMSIVYVAMIYVGATASSVFPADTQQAPLLVGIIERVLGNIGKVFMAIIVSLACLTTAVTIASAVASFFSDLFKNKITYTQVLAFVCIVCPLISLVGLTNLISILLPIMMIFMAPIIVITFLGLIDPWLPNDGIYKFACGASLLFGVFDVLTMLMPANPVVAAVVNFIPLGSAGFCWLIPSIIGGVIGYFVYKGKPRQFYVEEGQGE